MPLRVKVQSFLRNLFLSRRVEVDLDQEVHSHLEMLIAENIRAGMSPEEAQRAARMELGGIEQVKEEVRDRRVGNPLPSAFFHFPYRARQLRQNPPFPSPSVLTPPLRHRPHTAPFSAGYPP